MVTHPGTHRDHEPHELLAFDIGDVRIGVARASSLVRLAEPLCTLKNGPDILAQIDQLIAQHLPAELIVGLPRGLDGQETPQTASVRAFVTELSQHTAIPIHLQDEALTSKKAEDELRSRNKPYNKEDIDALAATFILEDYLAERHGKL